MFSSHHISRACKQQGQFCRMKNPLSDSTHRPFTKPGIPMRGHSNQITGFNRITICPNVAMFGNAYNPCRNIAI
jgi:hypothetical protein